MKILVANLGSTSFKYRLFDMTDERQLARGGIERIGAEQSRCFVEIGEHSAELVAAVPDHAVAVRKCLERLTAADTGCLQDAGEVAAIGFKAVHGGSISGVNRVTDEVLSAMETMNQVSQYPTCGFRRAMNGVRQGGMRLFGAECRGQAETGMSSSSRPWRMAKRVSSTSLETPSFSYRW